MQFVSNGDNLQEMPNPVFWEKYEKTLQKQAYSNTLKILPPKTENF